MRGHRWLSRSGRTAIVALAGGVIGWGISKDLDWSAAAGARECAQSTGICVGTAPIAGLVLGVTFTVAVCWAVMAVAGIRPLALTVPGAILLVPPAVLMVLRSEPGGRLHPAWVISAVLASALALLAFTVDWARAALRH